MSPTGVGSQIQHFNPDLSPKLQTWQLHTWPLPSDTQWQLGHTITKTQLLIFYWDLLHTEWPNLSFLLAAYIEKLKISFLSFLFLFISHIQSLRNSCWLYLQNLSASLLFCDHSSLSHHHPCSYPCHLKYIFSTEARLTLLKFKSHYLLKLSEGSPLYPEAKYLCGRLDCSWLNISSL